MSAGEIADHLAKAGSFADRQRLVRWLAQRRTLSTTISAKQKFIEDLKAATCATDSASGFPTFLFAYSDVCPSTGCAAGCGDAGLPDEGNGYFGIFHTEDYMSTAASLASPFREAADSAMPLRQLARSHRRALGEGLTTAKMAMCRWLHPFLVARIEFLEWTPENRLRHPQFAGIRSDKNAHDVVRELQILSGTHP